MLIFLDKYDTAYVPEKFFHESILLKFCGAPGAIYRQFLKAAWSFGKVSLNVNNLKVLLFFSLVMITISTPPWSFDSEADNMNRSFLV